MNNVKNNIKIIEGTLESHGQGVSNLDVNVKRDVVFAKEDGTLERIKILGTLGMLGNYTEPGVSGKFHILELSEDLKILIAIERSDGKKIADIEAYEGEYKRCKSISGQASGLVFIGVLLIPVLLVGLFLIFMAMGIKKNSKPFLKYTPEEIKEYLTSEGIITS